MQVEPRDRPVKEGGNRQFFTIFALLTVFISVSLYFGGAFDGKFQSGSTKLVSEPNVGTQTKRPMAAQNSTDISPQSEDLLPQFRKKECKNKDFLTRGIFDSAQEECNQEFLKTERGQQILKATTGCSNFEEASIKKAIADGRKIFETIVHDDSKSAACDFAKRNLTVQQTVRNLSQGGNEWNEEQWDIVSQQRQKNTTGSDSGKGKIVGNETEKLRVGHELFGYLLRYLAICPTTESAAQKLLKDSRAAIDMSKNRDFAIHQGHITYWMSRGAQKFNAETSQFGRDQQCVASEGVIKFLDLAASSGWETHYLNWDKRRVFDDVRLSVNFSGNCRYRRGTNSSFSKCDSLAIFYNFRDLHSEYVFGVNSDFYTFSGHKERQPNYEKYTLFIDHFGLMTQAATQVSDADGTCQSLQNTDGSVYYSITCRINETQNTPVIEFILDGIYNHVQTKFLE